MELSVGPFIKNVMKLVMTLFSAKDQQLLAKARQPKFKKHHQNRPFIAISKDGQAVTPVGARVDVWVGANASSKAIGSAHAGVGACVDGIKTRPLLTAECDVDTCHKQMRHWRDLAGFLLPPAIFCVAMLSGCSDTGSQPISQSTGLNPTLPAPQHALIPTVNIAPAIGWPVAKKPVAAPGTKVAAFAQGLDHPRWLYLLPNGDVLVAETNAPAKPDDATGIIGWMMGLVMKRAGATVPSANQIRLLRDTNGDGVADLQTIFLAGLNSPFGMALVDGNIYIANSDAVMRFAYHDGDTKITTAGTINHHWTKNMIASRDGRSLFVTVGSNSNAGERGMAEETERAAIWKVDLGTGTYRVFASGLRNPNGMAWEPLTGALWTVVNERDELGNDLVPDYLTSVQDGGFYGWPYSYFGPNLDSRVEPARPDLVAKAIIPNYALGAHTAPLGLVGSTGNSLPTVFVNGMFVGQHGSWNRKPPSGYTVIFVPFNQGQPYGQPIDVLTGFLSDNGNAYGRPVGVALDATGALLVADDVGNTIWRVSKTDSQKNSD